MLIILIPLAVIVIIVRYSNFKKLQAADLPLLKPDEFKQMKDFSTYALVIMLVFVGLSIIVVGVKGTVVGSGVGFLGFLIAATFDALAERIKHRGKEKPKQLPISRSAAIWKSFWVFVGLYFFCWIWGLVIFAIIMALSHLNVPSMNLAQKTIAGLCLFGIPALISFYFTRRYFNKRIGK